MRAPVVTLVSFVACAASLLGCGAPSPLPIDEASATEEELSARRPIPYVLQYVGEYRGDGAGRIDWIALRRTGTFAASVDGAVLTGKLFGPSKPATPLTLTLAGGGRKLTAVVREGYDTQPAHPRLDVAIDGRVETVTARWPSGNESMCDDGVGTWTDDDADPATGLFCVCPAKQTFIPSKGGCVR
jgi:hypothetical protein